MVKSLALTIWRVWEILKISRPVETEGANVLHFPQIFAKFDLLQIEANAEK